MSYEAQLDCPRTALKAASWLIFTGTHFRPYGIHLSIHYTLATFTLTFIGAGCALPAKRDDAAVPLPTSSNVFIQDLAWENVAYATVGLFGYQYVFAENFGQTPREPGFYSTQPISGTMSAAGDEVQLTFAQADGPFRPWVLRTANDTTPITAKLEVNEFYNYYGSGDGQRQFWYLQSPTDIWSVIDASEDSVRGGALLVVTNENGRPMKLYLAIHGNAEGSA
ncbi:hypothetical protein K488DRAFT_70437 [Vararia minispora EC-137]|uniref:Uncharacterized protein n=1 Tax=Vararia minispora EC-137 TaxID=1314806 RepID=A0ACB8QMU2_9AGAM|nr:hypothetical protein K488DRAFT_70437 [Vararia minispora EC-137]